MSFVESSIKVALVDDHPCIVQGLRPLIEADPGLAFCGTAGTLSGAYSLIRQARPDVLVIDIGLPDGNALSALPRLRAEVPGMVVVIFTLHIDPGHLQRALEQHVRGYVLKASDPASLVQAVHAVHKGGVYIDPILMERAMRGARPAHHHHHQPFEIPGAHLETHLSEREIDVIRMTAFGYSIKEISEELGISPKSVETYKSRASAKLELPSRAAIVRYAIARGWFDSAAL